MKLLPSFAALLLIPASLRTCFACLYMYCNQVVTDFLLRASLAR